MSVESIEVTVGSWHLTCRYEVVEAEPAAGIPVGGVVLESVIHPQLGELVNDLREDQLDHVCCAIQDAIAPETHDFKGSERND